jgi:hypothetical protein
MKNVETEEILLFFTPKEWNVNREKILILHALPNGVEHVE